MSSRGIFFFPIFLVLSCAHLAVDDISEPMGSANPNSKPIPPIDSRLLYGVADYQFEGSTYKAEWMACERSDSVASVVVTSLDEHVLYEQGFCSQWFVQSFLSHKLDVIAVNQPGYGKSSGPKDFLGSNGLAALVAGITAGNTKGTKSLRGAWGYGSGAGVVALFAKSYAGLEWLILGGGTYDLDSVEKATSSTVLRDNISEMRKKHGDRVAEDRSVGYDASGLPKIVKIYHGEQDRVAPLEQARAFSDLLKSSGREVTLQVLSARDHDLVQDEHRQVLNGILTSIK